MATIWITLSLLEKVLLDSSGKILDFPKLQPLYLGQGLGQE
jgi:hypothetical protein